MLLPTSSSSLRQSRGAKTKTQTNERTPSRSSLPVMACLTQAIPAFFASLDNERIPWKELVLVLVTGVYVFELYLSLRQYKVYSYPSPPASLAQYVELDTYRKSQAYGKAKARFAFVVEAWVSSLSCMVSGEIRIRAELDHLSPFEHLLSSRASSTRSPSFTSISCPSCGLGLGGCCCKWEENLRKFPIQSSLRYSLRF